MQLYYHRDEKGNFGDDLNDWIWDKLLPGWRGWDDSVTLIGIGTLLNTKRLDHYLTSRILVLGSGAGYGPPPKSPLPRHWDIRAVRGPRTAELLGLPPEYGIIDLAIMVSEMVEFRSQAKIGGTLFIPHIHSVERHDWPTICADAGVRFVSPRWDARKVITEIASASLVIAESMHAAIIADAFRVPWVPARFSNKINTDKWNDWSGSLHLEARIPLIELGLRGPRVQSLSWSLMGMTMNKKNEQLAATQRAAGLPPNFRTKQTRRERLSQWKKRLIIFHERKILPQQIQWGKKQEPYLSSDANFNYKKQRLKDVLAMVRADYGG